MRARGTGCWTTIDDQGDVGQDQPNEPQIIIDPAQMAGVWVKELETRTLPPKRAEDTETSWADPWKATEPAREAVAGRLITDAINSDPAEVERLRKARRDAREGRRSPRRDATKSS